MDKKGVPPGSSRGHPPDMQPISEELRRMKFRKKFIGGVDEADVWKKLEGLQQTYESVLDAQAAYYQALIDERDVQLKAYSQNTKKPQGAQTELTSPRSGIAAGSGLVAEEAMPGGGVADG